MEISLSIDRGEALRYAGMQSSALPAELEDTLQKAMEQIRQAAQPRVQHRLLDLQHREDGLFLSTGQALPGGDIRRTLQGAQKVLLFAVTLGTGVDAALRRAGLPEHDRALATALVYGVLERRLTLDDWIDRLSSRPPERISPQVRTQLRLGL